MNNTWLRTISIFEMIGGATGILFVLSGMALSGFAKSFLLVVPILMAIDGFSLVAGIYLWKETKFGRIASIAVQFIQLPKIASPFLVFAFSFGFDLYLSILSSGGQFTWGVQFRVPSDNQLFINMDLGQAGVGISLVSIIFLAKLLTYLPEEPATIPSQILPPSPDQYFTGASDKPDQLPLTP